MKSTILSLLLLVNAILAYSQNLDLIITSEGDSIACRIDSLSNDYIYLTTMRDRSKVSTLISRESVSEYKIGVINNKSIIRIPGTIYFNSREPFYTRSKKNSIIFTTGVLLWVDFTANYERIIITAPYGLFKTYSVRIGAGYWTGGGNNGPLIITSVSGMTGSNNGHLEMGIGGSYMPDIEERIMPAVSLGYRYQKTEDGVILRIGASFPEALYISLGFSF